MCVRGFVALVRVYVVEVEQMYVIVFVLQDTNDLSFNDTYSSSNVK